MRWLIALLLILKAPISQCAIEDFRTPSFIDFAVFNHNISLPFHFNSNERIASRFSGLQLGCGYQISRQNRRVEANFLVSLASYKIPRLHYGYELNNSFLIRYKFLKRVALEIWPQLGYLHTFQDAPSYKLKNGTWKQVRDWGRLSLTGGLAFGMGISITERLTLYAKYQFHSQAPFARKAGLMAIPHTRALVGIRLKRKDETAN